MNAFFYRNLCMNVGNWLTNNNSIVMRRQSKIQNQTNALLPMISVPLNTRYSYKVKTSISSSISGEHVSRPL